jgi:hypothetical protein
MAWPDQNPPAIDIILHLNVPCAGGSPAYLEIDRLPDARYRANRRHAVRASGNLPDPATWTR